MKKSLLAWLLLGMLPLAISAQNPKGRFSVTPMAGINVTGFSEGMLMNTEPTPIHTGIYRCRNLYLCDILSLYAGLNTNESGTSDAISNRAPIGERPYGYSQNSVRRNTQ